jgi:hypothetical protein
MHPAMNPQSWSRPHLNGIRLAAMIKAL